MLFLVINENACTVLYSTKYKLPKLKFQQTVSGSKAEGIVESQCNLKIRVIK